MGEAAIGFDWRWPVAIFLRKSLVDDGISCIDHVRVVFEPHSGNDGDSGGKHGESAGLFISSCRFDRAVVLDERSSRDILFHSGDCFGAGVDHALEFPDVRPASPVHMVVKEP